MKSIGFTLLLSLTFSFSQANVVSRGTTNSNDDGNLDKGKELQSGRKLKSGKSNKSEKSPKQSKQSKQPKQPKQIKQPEQPKPQEGFEMGMTKEIEGLWVGEEKFKDDSVIYDYCSRALFNPTNEKNFLTWNAAYGSCEVSRFYSTVVYFNSKNMNRASIAVC